MAYKKKTKKKKAYEKEPEPEPEVFRGNRETYIAKYGERAVFVVELEQNRSSEELDPGEFERALSWVEGERGRLRK